jgi:hypothetical protein
VQRPITGAPITGAPIVAAAVVVRWSWCGGRGAVVTDAAHLLATVRPCPDADDSAGLIGQLRELEDLKSAAPCRPGSRSPSTPPSAGPSQHAAGIPAAGLGAGVAAQIALARRAEPVKLFV